MDLALAATFSVPSSFRWLAMSPSSSCLFDSSSRLTPKRRRGLVQRTERRRSRKRVENLTTHVAYIALPCGQMIVRERQSIGQTVKKAKYCTGVAQDKEQGGGWGGA